MDRVDIKPTENQLKQEFIQGYGYPPRIADALVSTFIEHIQSNYPDEQRDGQVIYRAKIQRDHVRQLLLLVWNTKSTIKIENSPKGVLLDDITALVMCHH